MKTVAAVIRPPHEGGVDYVLEGQWDTAPHRAKHWTRRGTTDESVLPERTDLSESDPQAFQKIVGVSPT